MKKIFFIVALLGCALVYLQQQSYAEKVNHKEYASSALKECNDCHKGEGIAPNHGADFVREHRVLAGKAGNNCAQCHQQKWCLDCHQGGGSGDNLSKENFSRDYKPKSHRSDFISLHPLKAKDNPQQCYRCHEAKAFCNSCHSRFPMGRMQIKSHLMLGGGSQTLYPGQSNYPGVQPGFPGLVGQRYSFAIGEHSTEARRNLQSCQTCHPDGDVCIRCHSSNGGTNGVGTANGGVNPHPKGFKANNYKGRINVNDKNNVCRKCHLPGTY